MSQRKLVRLRDRYPSASRMTVWRLRNEPGFPSAVILLKSEFFYEDELEVYEQSRRRIKPQRATSTATA